MASSRKKRSRAVVTLLLCLVAVCIVAALVLYGLANRKLKALQQGADFFDEARRQQAAPAVLVAQQAFAQLGAAELVDVGVVTRVVLAAYIALQHVALATGQGAQLAHAAQIARDAVVDLFGAESA